MTSLRIISDAQSVSARPVSAEILKPIYSHECLRIQGAGLLHQWRASDGGTCYLFGTIIGFRQSDGTLSSPGLSTAELEQLENPQFIPEVEGRFILVRVDRHGTCEIWADQFGRMDVYWQVIENSIVLATSLDLLPVAKGGINLDSVGVAHALTVYGARPAKKHTLYSGVSRLGVSQGIRFVHGRYELLDRKFVPASLVPVYQEKDLQRYADSLLEAIRARASMHGNVVYLSSGWDSTSILAALVHIFGNRKVRAVIGRMQYSDRTGVINQFEIDRARAVADYFRVRLDIVELDYRRGVSELVRQTRNLFRAQQFANITAFNHWKLAEGTAATSCGDETVFAGEMSDGAHNLGFSQFITIFHPASLEFREYSDKMASYLFGPTFLQQLQKGAHEKDPVWQLFKQQNPNVILDPVEIDEQSIGRQLLASFFLRGGRIPLYSLENTRLLKKAGRKIYSSESERAYLDQAAESMKPDTLYSYYLHLYNSFHWQGGTVSTLEYTAEAHGLRCALPFHDGKVIDFLSAMPESWGRGLDLNPTKYPLKWMLKNRIDYPNHLQVGPHSYLYDVMPEFSLIGEIINASGFKPVFKDTLKNGVFIEKLDSNFFDLDYINQLIKSYLSGTEVSNKELSDLSVLATHSMIGTYS
jgi:hypothetical protein